MDLTDEMETRINEYRDTRNGRYPRNDTASKWWKCSIFEAEQVIDEYRRKHGDRIRQVAKKAVQYTPELAEIKDDTADDHSISENRTHDHTTRKWYDWAIDGGALALAVIIDILLNFVVFVTIAPDLITQIGMGALSLVVVLFGLRGWLKGGLIGVTLWAMFAIVVTFSDLSFALYVTSVQTENAKEDTELVRLTAKVDHDQKALDELQAGYLAIGSGYRSELTVRQEAIAEARKALESSEAERRSHILATKQDGNKQATLSADGVFSAIPSAVESGRWIQLVFFLLIFLGLQGTIIVSATSAKSV